LSISIQHISKSFKDVNALKNISLEIKEGELFGLIGPDGAGKTTLFRILTTLLIADEGKATVVDYDVVDDIIRKAPGANDDASGVADAMGWKKFAVIGHSMGAGVASYLAAVQNDRVSHAIFIEGLGGLSGAPGNTTQTLRQAVSDMKRVRKKRMPLYGDVEAAVQMRMKGVGFTLSHNSARLLCERGLKKVENGVTWCSDPRLKTSSALRATEEQVCDLVGSMEMPSLLILGDRGIKLSAMNFDKRILAHKNLVVKNIPGGHHLHMEEQSMKVAEIISDFLKENGIPLT